ncbi:18922_t:CDS:2 [Dentiscutata erythropus]|uniref:18922_t:CDS:1 n=1 Tax=Dentiscutata erythropus TaxID=1348616 RepID=A0A9N9BSQ7_9GLOM|nr:18922_t:CDS:2 [Dentiscutata erythropus]
MLVWCTCHTCSLNDSGGSWISKSAKTQHRQQEYNNNLENYSDDNLEVDRLENEIRSKNKLENNLRNEGELENSLKSRNKNKLVNSLESKNEFANSNELINSLESKNEFANSDKLINSLESENEFENSDELVNSLESKNEFENNDESENSFKSGNEFEDNDKSENSFENEEEFISMLEYEDSDNDSENNSNNSTITDTSNTDNEVCSSVQHENTFILCGCVLSWSGDIPGITKLICLMGHNSYRGCCYCNIKGIYSSHIYYPTNPPRDQNSETYDSENLPIRTHNEFKRQIKTIQNAQTKLEKN